MSTLPSTYVGNPALAASCWPWLFLAYGPKHNCHFLIYWACFCGHCPIILWTNDTYLISSFDPTLSSVVFVYVFLFSKPLLPFFLFVSVVPFSAFVCFGAYFVAGSHMLWKTTYSIQKKNGSQVICSTKQLALHIPQHEAIFCWLLVSKQYAFMFHNGSLMQCIRLPSELVDKGENKVKAETFCFLDQVLEAALRLPVNILIWPLYHVPCFLFFL